MVDHAREGRMARARRLAGERAASAEILSFYADLATFQQVVLDERLPVRPAGDGRNPSFNEALSTSTIATLVPQFLSWLHETRYGGLAAAANHLLQKPSDDWPGLFERYLSDEPDTLTGEEIEWFVVEALLQPFAEALAAEWRTPSPRSNHCPVCGKRPFAAALRERGHGATRSLICGLCLTEWPALRMVCAACGEARFDSLPIYRADEFAAVRVDACDTCHTYIKTIDFTADGAAVPLVDDLASLPLDLWASEQRYRKIRPNLLRL